MQRLNRYCRQKQRIQLIEIPLIEICIVADADIHAILRNIRDHLIDHIPHTLSV